MKFSSRVFLIFRKLHFNFSHSIFVRRTECARPNKEREVKQHPEGMEVLGNPIAKCFRKKLNSLLHILIWFNTVFFSSSCSPPMKASSGWMTASQPMFFIMLPSKSIVKLFTSRNSFDQSIHRHHVDFSFFQDTFSLWKMSKAMMWGGKSKAEIIMGYDFSFMLEEAWVNQLKGEITCEKIPHLREEGKVFTWKAQIIFRIKTKRIFYLSWWEF